MPFSTAQQKHQASDSLCRYYFLSFNLYIFLFFKKKTPFFSFLQITSILISLIFSLNFLSFKYFIYFISFPLLLVFWVTVKITSSCIPFYLVPKFRIFTVYTWHGWFWNVLLYKLLDSIHLCADQQEFLSKKINKEEGSIKKNTLNVYMRGFYFEGPSVAGMCISLARFLNPPIHPQQKL